MLNYKKMTAKEAIRAAKEESDLTAEQIARRLNVSTSVISRRMITIFRDWRCYHVYVLC